MTGSNGNREAERRAFTGYRLCPDTSSVLLYDARANCEPDAGACVLIAVQALEGLEDLQPIRRVEPNAVIRDMNDALPEVCSDQTRTFGVRSPRYFNEFPIRF